MDLQHCMIRSRSRIGSCILVHFVLFPITSAHTQEQPLALTAPCYALQIGQWSRGYTEPFHHSLPDTIRFDSIRGAGVFENKGRLLQPRVVTRQSSYSYWNPLAGDSVLLVWTTGLTAVAIRARIEGDTIRGVAEASTDIVNVNARLPAAPVMAYKVECPPALRPPAVTPDTLDAIRLVLRGLTFGVPGYSAEPAPELFTIGLYSTHLPSHGVGSELAMGTMPRALVAGVIAAGVRAGPLFPLVQSERGLLTLSGGAAGILGFGAGGLAAPGAYAGGAAVFLKGDSGVRFGMTWHWFRGAESIVWLFEIGTVRKRSAK
jgi:hypothetical protein